MPVGTDTVKSGSPGAVQWNNHILCAIDVETTGFDHQKHEIIQIAIVPVTPDLKPNTKILPFNTNIAPYKPEKDWDPDALRTHKIDMVKLCNTGLDPWKVADLFDEWFQRLNLPVYKKIMPLAHNWPFEQRFLYDWLGPKSMDAFFFTYRDTLAMANMLNDIADHNNEELPFPKTSLTYLCSKFKIENQHAHDALGDAVATIEVYNRMMRMTRLA